jgi:hypothetical protein
MASAPTPQPWKRQAPFHLEQARRNYRLYQQLKAGGDLLEWAMVALFYTALHLIQACLIDMANHAWDYPHNHQQRSNFVLKKLQPLLRDYEFLQTRCDDARYHPQKRRPTLAELEQYEAQQFARIVAEARQRGHPLKP